MYFPSACRLLGSALGSGHLSPAAHTRSPAGLFQCSHFPSPRTHNAAKSTSVVPLPLCLRSVPAAPAWGTTLAPTPVPLFPVLSTPIPCLCEDQRSLSTPLLQTHGRFPLLSGSRVPKAPLPLCGSASVCFRAHLSCSAPSWSMLHPS